jgi:hypothetical protein
MARESYVAATNETNEVPPVVPAVPSERAARTGAKIYDAFATFGGLLSPV